MCSVVAAAGALVASALVNIAYHFKYTQCLMEVQFYSDCRLIFFSALDNIVYIRDVGLIGPEGERTLSCTLTVRKITLYDFKQFIVGNFSHT